jgi:hypothetical protein
MADLDRSAMIELLGRLGSDEDAAVLAAARELDRMLKQAGATWDDLVKGEADPAPLPIPQPPEPADPPVASGRAGRSADAEEIARLIDRLLARKDLSGTTREDLAEMKRAAAAGSLDPMDGRYIRALAKRLGS